MKRVFPAGIAIAFAVFANIYPNSARADALYPAELFAPPSEVEIEVGVRYWYSKGKSQKTLFGFSDALLVSQLTWTGATGQSGEGYFNIAQDRVFAKGFIGAGYFGRGGNLQDEDFPPVIAPYSSTNSDLKNGRMRYASGDIGYYLLDTLRVKLGGFVGYHYNFEKMDAFGCAQTATNPLICVPTIPTSVLGITQENRWHAIRLGAAGQVYLMPNLKLSGDAAWLPYARVTGADTHWLRIGTTFNGPTQEAGHGNGMQLEGVLSYVFENNVTLGIGARYWRMQVPHGTAHFEDSVIGGGAPQIEKMRIERYGMFVQLGYKY